MLDLTNTTLITINGIDPTYPLKALIYSSKNINFGSIKLLSCRCPDNLPDKIEYIEIPKLTHGEYSNFIIKKLVDYIDTDYVLIIQDDGFVLNPDKWDNSFFNYDYIGAPWINHAHFNYIRVGNGGFSFRSKKFLEVSSLSCSVNGFNEDHVVCITYRDIFLSNGIKYAPLEIAMKFSLEIKIDECDFNYDNVFGFHGNLELKNKILNNI